MPIARQQLSTHRILRPRRPMLRNSVLRLRTLHTTIPSNAEVQRDRRGFGGGRTMTIAHIPSLYAWLRHRGGICLEEADRLKRQRRLLVDDAVPNDSDLIEQRPWADMESRRVEIITDDGRRVPLRHRPHHRSYLWMPMRSSMRLRPEMSDPRSFLHVIGRDAPHIPPSTLPSLSVVTPLGFVGGMLGTVLVTNDTLLTSHLCSPQLGQRCTYRVGLRRGMPSEEREGLVSWMNRQLTTLPRTSLDSPPLVRIESSIDCNGGDFLHVETSMFPFRCWARVRRICDYVRLVQYGPFDVDKIAHVAPLSKEELLDLFRWERKLKTNRLVLGLLEFKRVEEEDLRGPYAPDE